MRFGGPSTGNAGSIDESGGFLFIVGGQASLSVYGVFAEHPIFYSSRRVHLNLRRPLPCGQVTTPF